MLLPPLLPLLLPPLLLLGPAACQPPPHPCTPYIPREQLVPALTKWGGATVGATLLAIGAMGLYETFFEQHEEHDERDPAAEAFTGAAPSQRVLCGVLAVSWGQVGTRTVLREGLGAQSSAQTTFLRGVLVVRAVRTTRYGLFEQHDGTQCAVVCSAGEEGTGTPQDCSNVQRGAGREWAPTRLLLRTAPPLHCHWRAAPADRPLAPPAPQTVQAWRCRAVCWWLRRSGAALGWPLLPPALCTGCR